MGQKNSQGRKFNQSSSSLHVKLLKNIECVFSEKKKKGKEGIKEEKLYLFAKEEKKNVNKD